MLWYDHPIAEASCPTRYDADSSPINFRRSVRCGLVCLSTALLARLPSASRPHPPAGIVKIFALFNRLHAGLARFDARVSPTRLAPVLLIAAEKQETKTS